MQLKMQFEKLDLSQLVEAAALPFEALLFEKEKLLEIAVEPGITMNGSAEHLQQMIGVLLDNAGKYGDPGTVTVSLCRNGVDSVILRIANPGTPIPKEQQSKIFDRFYRGDAARTESGSFGLGLPIAKSITEAHKGKIWVESNLTGNCFCVQLPTI